MRLTSMLGLVTLLSVALPVQASICREKANTLPTGAPAPASGSIYHYTRPMATVSADSTTLVTYGRGYSETASDGRIIVWDAHNMQPQYFFYVPSLQHIYGTTRPVPPNGIALRGTYESVVVSEDGKYVAIGFRDVAAGRYCTDVYNEGRHVAHIADRNALTFYGEHLYTARQSFKRNTPTAASTERDSRGFYRTTFNGRVQETQIARVSARYQPKVRAGGRYVIFSGAGFDLETGEQVKLEGIGAEERFIGIFTDPGTLINNHRIVDDEIHVRYADATYVLPVTLDGTPSGGNNFMAYYLSDSLFGLFWRKRDEHGEYNTFMQLYDVVTGEPMHENPIETPHWGMTPGGTTYPTVIPLNVEEILFIPPPGFHQSAERIAYLRGEQESIPIMLPPRESEVAEARVRRLAELRREAFERERQAALVLESSPQGMFIQHIHTYGPDTTDVASFSYDVALYCQFGGPNCQALRVRSRNFEDQRNRAAERANLQRIWSTMGPRAGQSLEEFGRASRARSECWRKLADSVRAQTYGQQSWRYEGQCN